MIVYNQPSAARVCVLVYSKQKQCQVSFYFNDSTYSALYHKCSITHTPKGLYFRIFCTFIFFIHSSGWVADQVHEGLFLNLHECACLVGFVAVTDEFFSLYVTYKYTIRIQSSVLNKGIVYGAQGAQYSTAVKTTSQIAPTWKRWSVICVCVVLLNCILISKFVNYKSLTQKIEACSAEWTGRGIHAVWPLCVLPEPCCLAVISSVSRSLPDLRGVV